MTIPFFRILIPFLAGLYIGICAEPGVIPLFYLGVLLVLTGFLTFYPQKNNYSRRLLLVCMDVFLFLYGLALVNKYVVADQMRSYKKELPDSAFNFIAVIDELPVQKKESLVKCDLKLLEIKRGGFYHKTSGRLIAYFKGGTPSFLSAGSVLFIRSPLQEIPAPKNPYEFNYKTYLQDRQIYHRVFIEPGTYTVLPQTQQLNPIWQLGLDCKRYALNRLKNSSLTENGNAICSALLTGYDEEIAQEVLDSFAHTGTLHILSVSGLHTGLIYLALGFLIDLLDRRRKYKLTKFLIISLVLWVFALITGFSPPVLRAVVMFNLLGIGKIWFRNDYRNQLNILCVSAFALLSYNPFFIMDTGFQLSYLALGGLIYFQPKIANLWRPSGMLSNMLWQSVTASLAATISTLPLTLFYFKQFPAWFFICNILVVPASFLLLLLSFLVLIKINLAALVINYVVTGTLWFVNLFNYGTYGFVDRIDFNLTDALCLSALIFIISNAIHHRSGKLFRGSIILLICWQVLALADSYFSKRQTLFSVYQIKDRSVCALKNKTSLILNPVDEKNYKYKIKPHVTFLNTAAPVFNTFNYINYRRQAIFILRRPGLWPLAGVEKVTTLVLCNNYTLKSSDLHLFQSLKTIVADGSNNTYTIKKTQELSRKFGCSFYSTASQGAYILNLD